MRVFTVLSLTSSYFPPCSATHGQHPATLMVVAGLGDQCWNDRAQRIIDWFFLCVCFYSHPLWKQTNKNSSRWSFCISFPTSVGDRAWNFTLRCVWCQMFHVSSFRFLSRAFVDVRLRMISPTSLIESTYLFCTFLGKDCWWYETICMSDSRIESNPSFLHKQAKFGIWIWSVFPDALKAF